jgi:hypothetical protein
VTGLGYERIIEKFEITDETVPLVLEDSCEIVDDDVSVWVLLGSLPLVLVAGSYGGAFIEPRRFLLILFIIFYTGFME